MKLSPLIPLIKENKVSCPSVTQNTGLQIHRREHAIDKYGYGPKYTDNPNKLFWREKVDRWHLRDISDAKRRKCHNCAHFDISENTKKCIDIFELRVQRAQESEERLRLDPWMEIESGRLGLCAAHNFVCAGSRTCNSWKSMSTNNPQE